MLMLGQYDGLGQATVAEVTWSAEPFQPSLN